MIKTVKFGKHEIVLDNNVGWTMIYRDQFGHDIIPTIMPILAGAVDIISGIAENMNGKKEFGVEMLGELSESGKLEEAIIKASAAEFVDFINITWAMAKNADDTITDPKEWIRQFDEFPVDVIGPEVFKLIFKGMVSSKNLKRMNAALKVVHPTKQNESI